MEQDIVVVLIVSKIMNFDSAFCNLVDKLSETLTLIDVMKTKKKDTFYLRRVSVILKKFQQEIGLA